MSFANSPNPSDPSLHKKQCWVYTQQIGKSRINNLLVEFKNRIFLLKQMLGDFSDVGIKSDAQVRALLFYLFKQLRARHELSVSVQGAKVRNLVSEKKATPFMRLLHIV